MTEASNVEIPIEAAGRSGPTSARPTALRREQARWRAIVAVVVLLGGAAAYALAVDYPAIIEVELGGSRQPWPAADPAALRDALRWDLLLIAAYAAGLSLLCDVGRRIFWTPRARRVAGVAAAWSVLAAVADLGENALLYLAADRTSADAEVLLVAAAAAATVKFCLLVVSGGTAAVALAVTVLRVFVTGRPAALARRQTSVAPPGPRPDGGCPFPVRTLPSPPLDPEPRPPVGEGHAAPSPTGRDRRAWAWSVPGLDPAELAARRADAPVIGFCASGGGIRSASVTLGALQGLRSRLVRARYLACVSGGGYTVGALQMALQPLPQDAPAGDASTALAADVLLAGSVEEDHLRRHSNYLADTAGQWVTALAVVLRGVLISLVLVMSAVSVTALLLGFGYAVVPLAPDLGGLAPSTDATVPPFPELGQGALSALAALAVVAVVAYLASLVRLAATGAWSARASSLARAAIALTALVALLGVGVPALVWASAAVLAGPDGNPAPAAGLGGAGAVLFSYLAALAGMLWRRREALGEKLGRFRKDGSAGSKAVPGSLLQRLLVLAVLAVLAAGFLLVLGNLIATAAGWERPAGWGSAGDWQPVWLLLVALTVLAVGGGLLDSTWLGLHPFYRRRLASAFAVRRVARADGRVVARPYDYDREQTMLSTHAVRQPDFPEVVFVAAANLSGQERTPPGRRAVSFTFTSDWIGGPDVGYVATAQLESVVSAHLQRDLTVQAAVAVSGAAFASAMGRQARAVQTLFALTNARLGTWLPNPAFVRRWTCAGTPGHEHEWHSPGLPKLRRISYLLREVLGAFPPDERLLYVTDGGHYENLGLVELLRRRCTEIYCIDSSGDSPPFAGTLAEAITLAEQELGVSIVLQYPEALVPGGAAPLDPPLPLASLSGRLSQSAVVRGTITYPPESGLPEDARTGTILVAKALLTRDLPYSLLSYACEHAVFPHDSTGDQWFDHGQFDAYVALGRALAEQVDVLAPAQRVVDLRDPGPPTQRGPGLSESRRRRHRERRPGS